MKYFDHDPYDFKFINSNRLKGDQFPDEKFVYSFKNLEGKKFIVHIDRYAIFQGQKNLYAIKFFLSKDKNSPNRFKKIHNLPDTRRVLKTCIEILIRKWEDDKYACFAIHGVCTKEDLKINTKVNTYDRNRKTSRRYSVYLNYMVRYFPKEQFHHCVSEEYNSLAIFSNQLSFDKYQDEIMNRIIESNPTCIEDFTLQSIE